MAGRLESGFLRRRPLFWLALAFSAGIALDAPLGLSLQFEIALVFVGLALALVISRCYQRGAFASGLFSAILLGAFVHAGQFRVPSIDDVSRLTPERPCFAWVRGTIIETEWRPSRNARSPVRRVAWTLELDALGRDANELRPASGRIRVYSKASPQTDDTSTDDEQADSATTPIELAAALAEGDRVEFRALLEPLPIATIPDGFDYGAYLAGLGVHRIGTVSTSTLTQISGPLWWRVALLLRRFSGKLAAGTTVLLNGHAEQAGLLNAMVFGRRESLSVTDREAFAISGTAHLLAISGLHIQLLCALAWRVIGCFGISRRKSAMGVFAACLAYCLLTGSSPPAVRATVMFGAYVAASFFQREADPLSALGAAALIVLSVAPHDLFSAGFQLSFLAVFALHTLLPLFQATWESWLAAYTRPAALALDETPSFSNRAKEWIAASMLVTLSAWLATSPTVAWHMGRLSTLGLFVNLFALPFLSICMAFGSATIALGYLWPALGKVLGVFAWLSLATLETINSFCASLPGASIDMPRPIVLSLVVYAALLLLLWIRRPSDTHWKRVCYTVAACPLLLVSNALFYTSPSSPELTILDLSIGRAALIESNMGAALIDAGGAGQGLRITEILRRRCIHRLTLLVITSDQPGTLDGALEIVPRVPPQRVILPRCKFPSESRRKLEALLSEKNISYGSPVLSEELIAPAGVRWDFADDGPPLDQPASNISTLCVRATCGTFKTLFVDAKSSASLTRLLSKIDAPFSSNVLRITSSDYSHWPRETNELIRRSGSRIIVAGTGSNPEETSGVDFDAMNANVLSPHREGSIRFHADSSGKIETHAYRGEWKSISADSTTERPTESR